MHIIKRIAVTILILTLALNGGFMLMLMIPSIDVVIGMEPEQTAAQRDDSLDFPPELLELREILYREARLNDLEIILCLHDFETGGRIEINGQKQVYPASMIKTLLLLETLAQVETGQLSLADSHVLSEKDYYAGETAVTGSGMLQFAEPGTVYTVDELLSLMVTISDNVATNILFDLAGPDNVNAMAGRLGLENTAFTRKMYEIDSPLPSNFSTACDLTAMLVALEQRRAVGNKLSEKGIGLMIETVDKERIGRFLGDEIRLANKVGTVSGITGDMALLYFPDRPPLALTVAVINPAEQEKAARAIGYLAALIVEHLSSALPGR